MPTSIRGLLVTQPDSTSLESLANLADRALASENNGKDTNVGVSEINTTSKNLDLKNIQTYRRHFETSGAHRNIRCQEEAVY